MRYYDKYFKYKFHVLQVFKGNAHNVNFLY